MSRSERRALQFNPISPLRANHQLEEGGYNLYGFWFPRSQMFIQDQLDLTAWDAEMEEFDRFTH
jgi:hypothetical protein